MKVCTKCCEDLPITAFYLRKNGAPHGRCKECAKAASKEYRTRNAKAIAERSAAQYWADPESQAFYKRKLKYGVDCAELLGSQEGCCAICGVPLATLPPKNRHLDHCHVSGSVRGWLCNDCNLGVGRLKDDPALLRAAAEYIEKFKGKA